MKTRKEANLPQEERSVPQKLLIELVRVRQCVAYSLFIAMLKRSRKQDNTMTQYYIVIGAFVAICVAAVIYVLLNPKKPFSTMPVIDES